MPKMKKNNTNITKQTIYSLTPKNITSPNILWKIA